jgi:hypothetical protein
LALTNLYIEWIQTLGFFVHPFRRLMQKITITNLAVAYFQPTKLNLYNKLVPHYEESV